MKINLKEKKGITLIALVVTIIVLIILASVSMTLVLSNDGIIAKAKNAKTQTLEAKVKEEIQLQLLDLQAESILTNGSVSDTQLEKIITNAGGTAVKDDSGNITGVQVENTIIPIENVISETVVKETTGSAAAVKADPTTYYGKIVTGYTCAKTEYNWQIYFSDGNNIYITTTDYIKVADCPKGKNGSYPTNTTDDEEWEVEYVPYRVGWNRVINDYEGASDITDSRITPWLSYLTDYGTSTNDNMKATAYLLDTSVWSTNFKGEKADYAIGGPTLDMFCTYYKDTHPTKYVEFKSESLGYSIKFNSDSSYDNYLTLDSLTGGLSDYIISVTGGASSQWIASPSYKYSDSLYELTIYNGSVSLGESESTYGSKVGARPVVCLSSDVVLVEDGSGYRIQ